ncbi:phosphodiester glycosidase family protein [Salinarimonas rosea]|uniref:phosphodiester glycosidase family protein n=1 Tax=Salinarimonas rosea TaxID=552063 RepID=UPI00041096E5|nr:phosphodiester glycosidase family protein [Salinarimonas rosea]
MRLRPTTILGTLLSGLLAAAQPAAAQPAAASPAEPCAPRTFDGARFTVCVIDPRDHVLRLFAAGEDGRPLGRFANLPREIEGAPLVFAMNAGMYDAELDPIGLHVEEGETIVPVNTNDGPGNFHMKPNGVFFVENGRAGVMSTEAYVAARPDATLATQSGPMLVIQGEIHPRFIPGSDSLKRRNGVGVAQDGEIWFAISEEPVSFHTFARLFRDGLGTEDALFLDGGLVPSLYAPHLGRTGDGWAPLGPIIAAYARGD